MTTFKTSHLSCQNTNSDHCLYQWQLSLSNQPQATMGIFLPCADDLADIVAIYNTAIASKSVTADLTAVTIDMREAWFYDHLNNPNRPIYIIKQSDGRMIGWGSFSDMYARPAYHISSEISIYLHPDYQKNRIGSTLLAWMLKKAPTLGINNVVALIFTHNQPSLALFKRFEFIEWGYMPQVCDMDGFLADVVMLAKPVTCYNQ